MLWWIICLGVTLINPNLGFVFVFIGGFIYILLGIYNFEVVLRKK